MGQWNTRLFTSLEASRKKKNSFLPLVSGTKSMQIRKPLGCQCYQLVPVCCCGKYHESNLEEQTVYFSLHVTDYSPLFSEARGVQSRDPGSKNWSRGQGGVPVCWLPPAAFPIQPRDTAAHSGLDPLRSINTQEHGLQMCPQAHLMEASSSTDKRTDGLSFQVCLGLCQLDKRRLTQPRNKGFTERAELNKTT